MKLEAVIDWMIERAVALDHDRVILVCADEQQASTLARRIHDEAVQQNISCVVDSQGGLYVNWLHIKTTADVRRLGYLYEGIETVTVAPFASEPGSPLQRMRDGLYERVLARSKELCTYGGDGLDEYKPAVIEAMRKLCISAGYDSFYPLSTVAREAGLSVERTEQVLKTLSDYKVVVLGNARHGLTASFNGEWIARGLQYDYAR